VDNDLRIISRLWEDESSVHSKDEQVAKEDDPHFVLFVSQNSKKKGKKSKNIKQKPYLGGQCLLLFLMNAIFWNAKV